jgi:signal transduction histidine kinase
MKTIDELNTELLIAEDDVVRAQAMIDMHDAEFRTGKDIDRGTHFRDGLRLRSAEYKVRKIEKAIKNHDKPVVAPVKQEPISHEQNLEFRRVKLETLRLQNEAAEIARQAKNEALEIAEKEKTERHRISMDEKLRHHSRLVKKLHEIVGNEKFLEVARQVDEEFSK